MGVMFCHCKNKECNWNFIEKEPEVINECPKCKETDLYKFKPGPTPLVCQPTYIQNGGCKTCDEV